MENNISFKWQPATEKQSILNKGFDILLTYQCQYVERRQYCKLLKYHALQKEANKQVRTVVKGRRLLDSFMILLKTLKIKIN